MAEDRRIEAVEHERIRFETGSVDAEERFLRAYVLDAVDRLPDAGICDRFVFIRAGHDPSVAGGVVLVNVFGDPEAVVEQERGTWDALVEDGLLTGWTRVDQDVPTMLAEHFGAEAVDPHEQLRFVAGAMSRPAFDILEERPARSTPFRGERRRTGRVAPGPALPLEPLGLRHRRGTRCPRREPGHVPRNPGTGGGAGERPRPR